MHDAGGGLEGAVSRPPSFVFPLEGEGMQGGSPSRGCGEAGASFRLLVSFFPAGPFIEPHLDQSTPIHSNRIPHLSERVFTFSRRKDFNSVQ